MPHKINRVGDESIVVVEILHPFVPNEELPVIHEKLNELAGQLTLPIYRIIDLTDSKLDFSTAIEAMGQDISNDAGSASDRRFKLIFVGSGDIPEIIIEGLSQKQYGGLESLLFSSRKAAITHARQQLRDIHQV